ncbi:MAG: hypothetical protein HYU76_12545 [Betaproteobacteria bacterium]|nr:hypothetical protein [Betaproteobacteria bacterium]
MADTDTHTGNVTSSEGNVRLTHVIYGLHAFSAITGIVTAAFIVTAFLTGWPSIIAVIINYIKRPDVRGTYLDSHFSWQIRTFWFAALWFVIALILWVTVVGILVAWLLAVIAGIWVIYRIVRGWWRLADGKAMPLPQE